MRLDNYSQYHYVLYELILPYCSVCTPVDDLTTAWHTPITCEESSDSEYRLWFGSESAPVFLPQPSPSITGRSRLNSSIFKCVTNSSETTAKLQGGEGLASRGTMSITCGDFDGDPGPINFSEQGTFFGKLMARNVLDGKKIITHYYSVVNDVATEVDTSTHYVTNVQLTGGKFTLSGKDALKDVEAFGKQFPEPSEITLTADIDNSTTTIPVSDGSKFVTGSVFRIDDELFYVESVTSNDLTVSARGSSLSHPDGTIIYETRVDEHNEDATVQPCYVMSKTPLQDFLSDVFDFAGLTDFKDYQQWEDEITEWNADAFMYGIISSPQKVSDLLKAKLTDYFMDMWLDQPTQLLRLSAVSAWKQETRILGEGNDLSSLKIKTQENTRFSRALIYNRKRYQAESDEAQNYSKLTVFTDLATESSDLYGSPKLKDFGFSNTTTPSSAQILCSRYVQRYSKTPKLIEFTMEERKLASTQLGDIVDIVSRNTQSPSGQLLTARDRAQIIKIQPSFGKIGRQYNVTALAYVPLIASDPGEEIVITLSGQILDETLFARAGAPNVPVNITFIFDGCTIGSTEQGVPSVRAGAFEAGTRIKIICINGTQWSAKGGDGGLGDVQAYSRNDLRASASSGFDGADSYQSDGVETHIYLNYGNVDGYDTSAHLYAAGGGSGGAAIARSYWNQFLFSEDISIAAVGGSGGSGVPEGEGGNGTHTLQVTPSPDVQRTGTDADSSNGLNGTFSAGGDGVVRTATTGNPLSGIVTATATGGDGGASDDSEASSVISAGGALNVVVESDIGIGGIAGGAIKGSNVSVYNLAAQSSKFKQGNSDSFTLIDS